MEAPLTDDNYFVQSTTTILTILSGCRIDLLVGNEVIVELKAVERVLPIHEAQLVTYLRLSGHQVGLLLNFNVSLMKDGIRRMVVEARRR